MFNKPYGQKKSGGYSDRGGHGKSFGGGRDWKPMHDATCAGCGTRCQVPFKPNGRKPVYCSNCFVKDGDSAPKRFGGDRSERSERPSSGGSPEMGTILKEINNKLDHIIQSLGE